MNSSPFTQVDGAEIGRRRDIPSCRNESRRRGEERMRRVLENPENEG